MYYSAKVQKKIDDLTDKEKDEQQSYTHAIGFCVPTEEYYEEDEEDDDE